MARPQTASQELQLEVLPGFTWRSEISPYTVAVLMRTHSTGAHVLGVLRPLDPQDQETLERDARRLAAEADPDWHGHTVEGGVSWLYLRRREDVGRA